MEDILGYTRGTAWVIDGATSLTPIAGSDAATDGRWLAELLDQHLRSSGGADEPLENILRTAIIQAKRLAAAWASPPRVPPSATVGITRLQPEQIDYLVLSDVTLVLYGKRTKVINTKVITDTAVQDTSRQAQQSFAAALGRSGSYSAARAEVNDMLIQHRLTQMNRPGGYWVASFDAEAPSHAITGRVARHSYDTALLCTDGFARLVDLFGIFSSWQQLIESRLPLAERVQRLRAAEASDPECIEYPRWSVHDDASALLLRAPTT